MYGNRKFNRVTHDIIFFLNGGFKWRVSLETSTKTSLIFSAWPRPIAVADPGG